MLTLQKTLTAHIQEIRSVRTTHSTFEHAFALGTRKRPFLQFWIASLSHNALYRFIMRRRTNYLWTESTLWPIELYKKSQLCCLEIYNSKMRHLNDVRTRETEEWWIFIIPNEATYASSINHLRKVRIDRMRTRLTRNRNVKHHPGPPTKSVLKWQNSIIHRMDHHTRRNG